MNQSDSDGPCLKHTNDSLLKSFLRRKVLGKGEAISHDSK